MANDMRDVILNQHEQITRSLEVNASVGAPVDVDSVVLTGMGGSGHPGDLLNALGLPQRPLFVHRGYDLPLDYLAGMGLIKPLIVASSYSGNTEEALTGYALAQKQGLPLAVSSAGGKLQELAEGDGMPFAKIDFAGMQPRHTLFAAAVGVATMLKNMGVARDVTDDFQRVAGVMETVTPELEAPGKALAEELVKKIPVYTSSDSLGFAAKNFKIQTNENTKAPAFWNTFPELNHNEMVGFSGLDKQEQPGQFHVVMLQDSDDHPRVKARMQVTRELYESWGVGVTHFEVKGATLLEKLFYAITFGLWTTYHLANAYGIDPVPVDGVENFKTRLTEVAGEV